MIKQLFVLLMLVIPFFPAGAQDTAPANTGGLSFTATVGEESPGIVHVQLIDEKTRRVVYATDSDVTGLTTIKSLAPGTYTIKYWSKGYQPATLQGIKITKNKTTYANGPLSPWTAKMKKRGADILKKNNK
ncbi:MAG: hypothetical protein FD123_520 [Bacteroidetes bacterium]|nr:MAG: hypothetical protein FD123_520 [Bacteroidota bacterium]